MMELVEDKAAERAHQVVEIRIVRLVWSEHVKPQKRTEATRIYLPASQTTSNLLRGLLLAIFPHLPTSSSRLHPWIFASQSEAA